MMEKRVSTRKTTFLKPKKAIKQRYSLSNERLGKEHWKDRNIEKGQQGGNMLSSMLFRRVYCSFPSEKVMNWYRKWFFQNSKFLYNVVEFSTDFVDCNVLKCQQGKNWLSSCLSWRDNCIFPNENVSKITKIQKFSDKIQEYLQTSVGKRFKINRRKRKKAKFLSFFDFFSEFFFEIEKFDKIEASKSSRW